ncbi:terminase large subunit [Shewanella frigidimarina]|uniref:terminase large subunit n=1 Tax=Shewanella frigidimarina TaxID=56812 RepID=UPI003D78E52A
MDLNAIKDLYVQDLSLNIQSAKQVSNYCYKVLTGEITACKWIKLAATRHFDDLERQQQDEFKYQFNENRANRAIEFFKFIKHTKGELAGQPMELMLWQQFIVGSLFGWVQKEKHKVTKKYTRRFKTAEVFVARKNGKSTLASGIALYMLLADGEQGAEVYSAATTRDQAKIVFDDAKVMLRGSDLRSVVQINKQEILCSGMNSKFKPLSSDAHSLDGLNVHFAVLDEVHAHKTREVYDVIETATGSRIQSLIFAISTAGFILDGIATELWKYGEQTLQARPEDRDETFFAALYTIDQGDDFTDPKVWIKANPCLGVSKKVDDMERLCNKAKAMPSARGNYLTKHCNIFVNSTDAWLDIEQVRSCISGIRLEDYIGKKCYIGLDLAQKLDLTAMCLMFPQEDGGLDVFFKHYIPSSAVESASTQSAMLYRKWEQNDFLNINDGIATDFNLIEDDLREAYRLYDVEAIGYDPAGATQMSMKLEAEGLPMVTVAQNWKNISEPATVFFKVVGTLYLNFKLHFLFLFQTAYLGSV